MTTTSRTVPATPVVTTDMPGRRRTVLAGAGYVTSWVVGLALAPAAPETDAPAAEISAFYAAHGGGVLLSSGFVHGAAAVGLGLFALSLAQVTRARGGLRRAVVGTGLAAAALSLLQVVLAVLAVVGDAGARPELFAGINLVDVLKIACLAGFVAVSTTATAQAGTAPRWLRGLAVALVPVLVAGSAAFVVVSPALMTVLAVSLLGLLVWAGATAFVVWRTAR